ncbi:unnamed protein product [Closterium sp. NIES-53]
MKSMKSWKLASSPLNCFLAVAGSRRLAPAGLHNGSSNPPKAPAHSAPTHCPPGTHSPPSTPPIHSAPLTVQPPLPALHTPHPLCPPPPTPSPPSTSPTHSAPLTAHPPLPALHSPHSLCPTHCPPPTHSQPSTPPTHSAPLTAHPPLTPNPPRPPLTRDLPPQNPQCRFSPAPAESEGGVK